jgi:hypothetical protein
MKTKIAILAILLSIFAVVMFFSCDNPVSLGTKLDLEGPVVTITSPAQRQSVPVQFEMEGTVEDYSGIDKLLIKAVSENVEFPRQWRHQKGSWEVSSDFGATWSALANAEWDGTDSVVWKIPVNMIIPGVVTQEGEYTFNIQAWDKGGFSDDNSIKALVLIVDLSPPKVDISYPYLFRGNKAYESSPLMELHIIPDTGSDVTPKEYEDPAYLGKFLTQEFELKWQIEDINDVWSIDLRFYDHEAVIDNDPSTPLPPDYFYKFHQNMPPVPVNVNPADYIKPNGSVIIPDLTDPAGFYDQGGELKNPITGKTTLKVVAVCYDAAGNPNQEKTLGYFVYWPRANKPWIAFPDEMKKADFYYGKDVIDFEENKVLTVFPSKYIKSTVFQAHGVKKIEYEIYSCEVDGVTEDFKGTLTDKLTLIPAFCGTMSNTQYAPGMYTNIVSWQLNVPPLTGYYVVKATAYSNKDKPSDKYEMLFRVNDITFPDFTIPVAPNASDPLFLAINNKNQITISGLVGDVNEIETLCLVWINPESEQYKAMSQLAYFREKNYKGWVKALTLSKGTSALETEAEAYDKYHPNRLWKLDFQEYKSDPENYPGGIDPETHKRIYSFSQVIDLGSDLNIGTNKKPLQPYNPLSSQVFMLRAENPAKRCTIITYAPQGDTLGPEISIKNVVIKRGNIVQETCYPNQSSLIPIFQAGDTIQFNGLWNEDSMVNDNLYNNINTYFKNRFEIKVNGIEMMYTIDKPALTINRGDPDDPLNLAKGTWTLTTSVGTDVGQVPLDQLKDNLVVDVKTSDIGGNEAVLTNSWLIQSDHLVLNRISSEKPDGTYNNGQIEVFLEFSKPVKLASWVNTNTNNLELILSSATGNTARARYKTGQTDQNSRQYFVYTVASGQDTPVRGSSDSRYTFDYLNVIGIVYNDNVYTTSTAYNTTNYPFTWTRGGEPSDSGYEEVRLTMQTGKTGSTTENTGASSSKGYYVRTLPTGGSSDIYALISSKHVKIDTFAPYVTGITSTSPKRWYSGGDIYVTVEFSEAVKLGTAIIPRLQLKIGDITYDTTNSTADITVNDNKVTFRYNIISGHSSKGTEISVTGYSGIEAITDIAGNPLPTGAVSSYSGNKILNGIYVETNRPNPPNVRLFNARYDKQTNNTNVIVSYVSTTGSGTGDVDNYGSSTAATGRNLVNVYYPDLWLSLEGQGDSAYQYETMEYSIDGGTNWLSAPNTANNAFTLPKTSGIYNITARQKDKAGNVSLQNTNLITFTWNPGDIVSRVSSDNANGTYTHTTGRNEIKITVYFRIPVYFSSAGGKARIQLNVKDKDGSYYDITSTHNTDGSTAYNSIDFLYTVQNGDKIDAADGAYLDVRSSNIGTGTVAYDNNTGSRVRLSNPNILTLPSGTPKLDKQLTITTGNFTQTPNPTFKAYSSSDSETSNVESNENFHGIRSDDDSYWTTLMIPFDRPINKGSGKITITQIEGTGNNTYYRLPAVMTEAQYNRLRTVTGIDDYYVKGTNGATSTGASDTSTKYVLQYKYDPNRRVTADNTDFQGNLRIPTTFINAFRTAEGISVNVNAQAVTIDNNATQKTGTLKVRLTGSSAPQVPGATYTVAWEDGVVTDDLGNSITADSKNVTLGGVAKPFIRIQKTQDTIKVYGNPSLTQPRFQATQPFRAYARIDCRTPNSAITYTAAEGRTNFTGRTTANSSNNWAPSGTAIPYDTNNANNNNTTMLTTRPTTTNATTYSETTAGKQITLGNNTDNTSPTIDNVQGYQWWARARATVTVTPTGGTSTNYNSDTRESEEVAYRTVITYQLRNANNAINNNNQANRSIMESGDQIWIRGGDAVSSSSIPGFPLTWDDDWGNLVKKRAGIRLMTMVPGAGTSYTATGPGTNNVYTTAAGTNPGTDGNYYDIELNDGRQFTMYVVSNTNRTIRIHPLGTSTNGGTTAGQNVGTNITFTTIPGMNLNNSLWRFVTWEINATAYVDFIKGHDTDSTDEQVWQYGPRNLAYQADGWTSSKNAYAAYAGKHRWCDTGYNWAFSGASRQQINFSGTFMTRPDLVNNPGPGDWLNKP